MKINNCWGDLNDISDEKDALIPALYTTLRSLLRVKHPQVLALNVLSPYCIAVRVQVVFIKREIVLISSSSQVPT